jgi:chemotaxis protein CheD
MTITVNVSDARCSAGPADVIVTHSLGSCIGVCLYDPQARVAGLLHYQLPSAAMNADRAIANPFMFADSGVPRLISMMETHGALQRRLQVHIAGGAAMLNNAASFQIGKRNQVAIRKVLWHHGLFIASEDLGGNAPRTVFVRVLDGAVTIKSGGVARVA